MPSTTRLLISLRLPVLRTVRVRGVVCISSIPGVSLRSTLGYYSRYAYPCFARPEREVGARISSIPEVSSDALNHTVTHIAALSRASHGSLTSICVYEVGVVAVIDVKYIALFLFY